LREGLEKFVDCREEDVKNKPLISPGKIPQLFGQREGEQIILRRQLFVELVLNPLLAFMVLTMGAVSMPARVRNMGVLSALFICALRNHVRAVVLTALLHCQQRFFMTRQRIVFGKEPACKF